MKRQFDPAEPELMDRPQPVTAELASDLRNLRELNRHFGSHALILHFLRRWIQPGAQLRCGQDGFEIGGGHRCRPEAFQGRSGIGVPGRGVKAVKRR